MTGFRAKEPFVVMAKPAGPRCNLRCGYCYYIGTARSGADEIMTDETLERFVSQYIEASPGPVAHFVWHGGEPTLAGADFYRKAVRLQRKYAPEGFECWNNLQTNGILLNEEFCEFLAEERFDVGLSIDGTEALHDLYRRDMGGRGTYGAVSDTIRRLMSHGVRPDLLCAVTRETSREPLAVYRALRAFGTGWIQFIPIVRFMDGKGNVTDDSVTPEGYGDFLSVIFSEWLNNDIGRLGVQLFAETSAALSGSPSGLCHLSPVCGRAIVLESDGSVYSCDHFVSPEHRIGDIEGSHIGELIEMPEQRLFGEAKREGLPEDCNTCPWLPLCNGGCPKDRFGAGGKTRYYLCESMRRFFSRSAKHMAETSRLFAGGMSSENVMEHMRGVLSAKWKNIGRNDPCPCGSGRKAKQCCMGIGL